MAVLQIYAEFERSWHVPVVRRADHMGRAHSGKRHPFNGEIVAVRTQGSILEGRVIEDVDTSISTSHFQTCPDATNWRRK